MQGNYLNLLGIANRAGKCVFGEEQIVKEIQNGHSKLIILAKDIGPQTKKKLTDKCKFYKVPYVFADDRATLSHAVGKSSRVAISIQDSGFAKKLKTLLGETNRG